MEPSLIAHSYKIHLEPDLVEFSFKGELEAVFNAQAPVSEICLNILELAIWHCKLLEKGRVTDCPFEIDPEKETLCIRLPAPTEGDIHLGIGYQGRINDRMAGFYRSSYSRRGKERYMAVTQFEESDARRAFPCLDHPSQKAKFDIEIDIEPHLTVLANTPAASERLLSNGKKRIAFARTPKMSTYLVFWGAGEFDLRQDAGDPRVRVAALPGKKRYAGFALEFGRKALAFSEAYYGIAYPLPKLDLLAIPDFAFGAMENWGAITFRENLLLAYPGVTSKAGRQRIGEVIAHEIAHQWFGNLVTPADWKYLWLNESFATYFGYGILDHYYPRWDAWQQFLLGLTATALARDGLHETTAIEIPGGEHVVINTGTAPIIYNKGGSILRQIEGHIGADNFQKGLRRYLEKHAYATAASHHLWESFETVSEQPVQAIMQSWVQQSGYPIVEVWREGEKLKLRQQRFTYLPNDFEQKWLIPVSVRLFFDRGKSQTAVVLMEDREAELSIPAGVRAYKVNDRQSGFYRVRYRDAADLERLGRSIGRADLSPEDRWGLQNDLFALLEAAEISVDAYLRFLEFYDREKDYLPLAGMVSNLSGLYLQMGAAGREKIRHWARPRFEAILARIAYEPRRAEKATTSLLREPLIWQAALLGSSRAAEFGHEHFARLKQGGDVHPDLVRCVLQTAALGGQEAEWDWLDRRFRKSGVEHERLNILAALGCFRDEALLRKTQRYVLETVPPRNKFIPVTAMAANPYAAGLMWDWYVSNLAEIERFHPLMHERVIAAIVPTADIGRAGEIKAFFEDYLQKTQFGRDVIKLSLEKLEIKLRLPGSA